MTIKKIKIENPEEEYTEAELKQLQDEFFIVEIFNKISAINNKLEKIIEKD